MTETPEAGDQQRPDGPEPQESSNRPGPQGPGNEQASPVSQNGTEQAQAQHGADDSSDQLAVEQLDLEEDEKDHDAEQGEMEQAEVSGRKRHAEEQKKQIDEGRAQQERRFKKEEKERFIEFSKSGVSLRILEEEDARREDQLFVPPAGYQQFLEDVTSDTGKHILIVSGQKSSGKFMTAFHVARHAWEKKAQTCYNYCAQGNRTLLDIWADEKLPSNSVILFDEVFDKGQIDPDDLTNRYVHLNERLADKSNIWFIFTVLEGPILERLQETGYFPILSTAQVERRAVLDKLIDYYFPGDSFFEETRVRLRAAQGELPSPAHMRQLFETESEADAILRGFAKKNDQPQEAPSMWFSHLTPLNYQLYALLAVLFDKLDMPTLEEIYTAGVHALRRQGMDSVDEFIDPRRIGTNLMHARLQLQVRYAVLEFRNPPYRQYVEAQVENYQRLLWSLIDPDDPSTFEGLVGLLHRLSEEDAYLTDRGGRNEQSEQSRQLRYAIAVMIARVGVYHQRKLEILLNNLVNDQRAIVSLTAAEVLAEIARRGTHFDFIERILRTWIRSGRFDEMWAAAPSIAYIYAAIANTHEQERAAQDADESDTLESVLNTALEESETKAVEKQKQQGKGHLMRLQDMFTDLVKIHQTFSKEAIDAAAEVLLRDYLAGLRRLYEAWLEPITDDGLLFRQLSDEEKQRFLSTSYTENKQLIDDAVARDLGVRKISWLNQMRMVLVQTLAHIMHIWPSHVTHLVRMWLDRKDTTDPLWEIGHMGLNYLFQHSVSIKDPALLEQAAYPLLKLIPLAMRANTRTLGSLVQDVNLLLHIEELDESKTLEQHMEVGNLLAGDTLVYALVAMQYWYDVLKQASTRQAQKRSEEDEEDEENTRSEQEDVRCQYWQQTVSQVLANAMNNATQQERQRLRSALFLWVKKGDRDINRIARILISHAYVMDGIVQDLPTSKRAGLVVIDSQRREPEDRERVFSLLQSLSAIVPVRLHWLGYTRSSHFLESEKSEEQKQAKMPSFGPDDLLLRSANRPGLLLPILQPGQGRPYVPDQTCFVVVFHTEQILDLDELYPGLTAPQESRPTNPFAQHLQQRQHILPQASEQPWHGKVYLQTTRAEQELPARLVPLLTTVRTTSMATLEAELRKRVALTLRARPAHELWQELRACSRCPLPDPRTFAALSAQIDDWLEQLANTTTLYPDVSLFILWTIMIRSLEHLTEARQLVEALLQELAETDAEQQSKQMKDKVKRARKLRLQMGIACTRMLFHLHTAGNQRLPLDPYQELLLLLPQMMTRASSAGELLPVLSMVFELVRNDGWLRVVNDEEGAFFECIQKILLKELDLLRNWVQDYRYLLALIRVFLEVKQSFRDFLAFTEQVTRRYQTPRPARSGRGAPPAPLGEMAARVFALLPAQNNNEEQERYAWALEHLEFQQALLRGSDDGAALLAGLRNQEILLNHLSDEIQARQDGTIERLKEGNCYGIVMVEAGNKAAVRQCVQVVQEFVKLRRQQKESQITLMLQRLGEKEVLAKVRTGRKSKNEREIGEKGHLPQLMGPPLERYPADQVAFVLLITASSILDYDDWAEQDEWAGRLWVSSQGKWQPYHGELVPLGESTQITLEMILKTSGGERATL